MFSTLFLGKIVSFYNLMSEIHPPFSSLMVFWLNFHLHHLGYLKYREVTYSCIISHLSLDNMIEMASKGSCKSQNVAIFSLSISQCFYLTLKLSI